MRQEALETVFLEEVRRRLLATEGTSDIVQVRRTLISIARLLGIFRSKILCREYLRGAEPVVMSGPFSGMRLRQRAVEGASLPKLLGSYEHELHETIEAACRRDIDLVVNLGCADGYYAVGLARRMPNVTVVAVDIDEEARDVCAEVAALNGVEDRVRVSAELGADELQALLAGAIRRAETASCCAIPKARRTSSSIPRPVGRSPLAMSWSNCTPWLVPVSRRACRNVSWRPTT